MLHHWKALDVLCQDNKAHLSNVFGLRDMSLQYRTEINCWVSGGNSKRQKPTKTFKKTKTCSQIICKCCPWPRFVSYWGCYKTRFYFWHQQDVCTHVSLQGRNYSKLHLKKMYILMKGCHRGPVCGAFKDLKWLSITMETLQITWVPSQTISMVDLECEFHIVTSGNCEVW